LPAKRSHVLQGKAARRGAWRNADGGLAHRSLGIRKTAVQFSLATNAKGVYAEIMLSQWAWR